MVWTLALTSITVWDSRVETVEVLADTLALVTIPSPKGSTVVLYWTNTATGVWILVLWIRTRTIITHTLALLPIKTLALPAASDYTAVTRAPSLRRYTVVQPKIQGVGII